MMRIPESLYVFRTVKGPHVGGATSACILLTLCQSPLDSSPSDRCGPDHGVSLGDHLGDLVPAKLERRNADELRNT